MSQMEKATPKPALANFTTENPSSDEEEEEEDVQMSVDGDESVIIPIEESHLDVTCLIDPVSPDNDFSH
jgi:hypothetical protein